MNEKNEKNIFIFSIILIGCLLSAAIGAAWADENWKHDVLSASDHNDKPKYLSFDKSGTQYYFIVNESVNPYKKINISAINK